MENIWLPSQKRIDTCTTNGRSLMKPSSYVFRKNHRKIKGTSISTNVLQIWKRDKDPVSRTIVQESCTHTINLNEASPYSNISYIIQIILSQASTNPGREFSDSMSKKFPRAALAAQDIRQYDSLVITRSEDVSFTHQDAKMKDNLMGHGEIMQKTKIITETCWPDPRPWNESAWPVHGQEAIDGINTSFIAEWFRYQTN
jgi:hypothetical protein